MSYRVELTQSAQEDLLGITDYIELVLMNVKAADDFAMAAEKQLRRLAEFPMRYPLVDDSVLKLMGIRFVPIHHYIAFFIIEESTKTVHVVRVLYEKQNWNRLLKRDIYTPDFASMEE